jgi:hypothetical protein
MLVRGLVRGVVREGWKKKREKCDLATNKYVKNKKKKVRREVVTALATRDGRIQKDFFISLIVTHKDKKIHADDGEEGRCNN